MAQHANTDERKAAFLEALEMTLGVITQACQKSGIPRRTVYEWKKADSEFSAAVRDVEDVALDFAETQLFEQIRENNTAATIFYLKTKGKRRGYIERTEFQVDVNSLTDEQVDSMLNRVLEIAEQKDDE